LSKKDKISKFVSVELPEIWDTAADEWRRSSSIPLLYVCPEHIQRTSGNNTPSWCPNQSYENDQIKCPDCWTQFLEELPEEKVDKTIKKIRSFFKLKGIK